MLRKKSRLGRKQKQTKGQGKKEKLLDKKNVTFYVQVTLFLSAPFCFLYIFGAQRRYQNVWKMKKKGVNRIFFKKFWYTTEVPRKIVTNKNKKNTANMGCFIFAAVFLVVQSERPDIIVGKKK